LTCVTLLLADEHALVRQALRQQIEQANDLVVVAEADALDQVVELAQITAAEVVIVDVELVIDSGIEVCQPLLTVSPQTKLVFLSTADRDVDLVCAWTAGGSAFVLKTVEIDELIEVVRGDGAPGSAKCHLN